MKSTSTQTRKPATRKAVPSPVPVLTEQHPAEKAGMVVHQTVEQVVGTVVNGVELSASVVKNVVFTGGEYAFNFVKGLIKGH